MYLVMGAFFIATVLGLLVLSPFIVEFLLGLGVSVSGLEVNIIGSTLFFLVQILCSSPVRITFKQYLNRRLLPVNEGRAHKYESAFGLYDDVLSLRIKALLHPRLRDEIQDAGSVNRGLIRLKAEESITASNANPSRGRIDNLLLFLDLEFFVNTDRFAQPITLQGEPGSGKSTLIFELYRQQAMRLREKKQGWIPLLVFAHELSWKILESQVSLQGFLLDYFSRSYEEYDKEGYKTIANLIRDYYDELQFFIIVDGLDEIANRPLYERMAKKLNELLEAEWNKPNDFQRANRYLISCRTDDNQRLITSRLITLFPLEYQEILRHFKMQFRRHRKDTIKRDRFKTTLDGLAELKRNRLLQNYIQNPYLLSLILDYLGDKVRPPASRLSEVFQHVLRRELMKPRTDFEKAKVQAQRVGLTNYLSSVMAPYCLRRVIDTLEGRKEVKRDFRSYIEQNQELAQILFGGANRNGYLTAFCRKDEDGREDSYKALSAVWGDEKTKEFRAYLHTLNSSNEPDFIDRAVRWLQHDILSILEQSGVAEINKRTDSVIRFRHRRMQDYFMALFLDQVGINVEGGEQMTLDNAWMREPLRIFAAISSKPEKLIAAFLEQYESQGDPSLSNSSDDLDRAANLMLNASEAVAYLPMVSAQDSRAALEPLVTTLGNKAQQLFFAAAQTSTSLKTPFERHGWLVLEDKCLRTIRNIYSSEFLRGLGRYRFAPISFNLGNGRSLNSWQWINRIIQQHSDSYQHFAYTNLYPIKHSQRHFPIGRHSLFYYVLDEALCFGPAYDYLIKETHPEWSQRILPRLAFLIEKLISLFFVLALIYIVWDPSNDVEATEIKVAKTGVLIGAGLLMGVAAQIRGLMSVIECYHLIVWCLLIAMKRLWRYGKTICLRLGRWLIETAAPFVFVSLPPRVWQLTKSIAKLVIVSLPLKLGRVILGLLKFLFVSIPRWLWRRVINTLTAIAQLLRRPATSTRKSYDRERSRPASPAEHNYRAIDDVVGKSNNDAWGDFLKEVSAALIEFMQNLLKGVYALAKIVLVIVSGVILIYLVVFYVVPEFRTYISQPAVNWFEHQQHRLNVGHFNDSVREVEDKYQELQSQVSAFKGLQDSESTIQTGTGLSRTVGEYLPEVDKILNSGRALQGETTDQPGEYQEIQKQIDHLVARRSEFRDLQSAVIDKVEAAEYAVSRESFLSNANKAMLDEQCRIPAAPEQKPINDSQECIRHLEGFMQGSVSLQSNRRFASDPSKERIVTITQGMSEQRAKLQEYVDKNSQAIVTPTKANETQGFTQGNSPQPTAVATDPMEDERMLVRQRIEAELKSPDLKTFNQDITRVSNFVQGEESKLKEIKAFTMRQEYGWREMFGLWQRSIVAGYIDYLDQISVLDAEVSTLGNRANGRKRELEYLIRDVERVGGLRTEKESLDRQLADLATFQTILETHERNQKAIDLGVLQVSLQFELNQAQASVEKQTRLSIFALLAVALLGLGTALKRRLGNQKGFRQVEAVKGDFDQLLKFITTNGFTLTVNERAIVFLRNMVYADPDSLNVDLFKKVSDAAEQRLGKAGYLNESIGRLLKDIAEGIDNILNRRQRSH